MAKAIPTAETDPFAHAMNETSAGFAATTRAMTETLTAAGTVIGHRMVLGAQAASDPMNEAHHEEFSLMTSEKVAAFTDAGAVMMDEMQGLNSAVMKFVTEQASETTQAVIDLGSAQTPFAMFEVQQRFMMESWTRGLKLATLGSGLSAQIMAPVHSVATANAARLTKKARKPD